MTTLNALSAEEFRVWLLTGFEHYVSEEERHKAFPGTGIRLDKPIVLELERIYDQLAPSARNRFRQGLAEVPRSTSTTSAPSTYRVLMLVLMLAGRIGAFELLPGAHGLLISGPLLAPRGIEGREARICAWTFIASFAPNPKAVHYIRAAYDRVGDDEDLLQLFFFALCRAAPDKFAELLVDFAHRLGADRFKKIEWQTFIWPLLNAVGLQLFALQLPSLPYARRRPGPLDLQQGVSASDFSGMIIQLFARSASPFRLSLEDTSFHWIIDLSDKFGSEKARMSLSHYQPGHPLPGLLHLCFEERQALELEQNAKGSLWRVLKAVIPWAA